MKIIVPYLEGVSLEEDDSLQELWANLFANYIDSSKNLTINVYPNILKQLSTNEVAIIKFIQSNKNKVQFRGYEATKEIHASDEELLNLERLNILKESIEISQYGGDFDNSNGQWKWDFEEISSGEFYITDFGFEFLNACTRKKQKV